MLALKSILEEMSETIPSIPSCRKNLLIVGSIAYISTRSQVYIDDFTLLGIKVGGPVLYGFLFFGILFFMSQFAISIWVREECRFSRINTYIEQIREKESTFNDLRSRLRDELDELDSELVNHKDDETMTLARQKSILTEMDRRLESVRIHVASFDSFHSGAETLLSEIRGHLNVAETEVKSMPFKIANHFNNGIPFALGVYGLLETGTRFRMLGLLT